MRSKTLIAKVVITVLLVGVSLPAHSALITYSFFSNLFGKGSAFATGTLVYNTQQETFVAADIYTTASRDLQGNVTYPAGSYTQVNLLGQPASPAPNLPFALTIWGPAATGVVNDPMMYIAFFPWESGNLNRLEVLAGVEGPCSRTRNVNGCLLRQDRIMIIGTGRALAQEITTLDGPSSALTLTLEGLTIAFLFTMRRRLALLRRQS